jgi:hypothetical protein
MLIANMTDLLVLRISVTKTLREQGLDELGIDVM